MSGVEIINLKSWTLKEMVTLIKCVEVATKRKILDIPIQNINFDDPNRFVSKKDENERIKLENGQLKILCKTVSLDELLNAAVKDRKRVRKQLINRNICQLSFGPFQGYLPGRSKDEICHVWSAVILPLFAPS